MTISKEGAIFKLVFISCITSISVIATSCEQKHLESEPSPNLTAQEEVVNSQDTSIPKAEYGDIKSTKDLPSSNDINKVLVEGVSNLKPREIISSVSKNISVNNFGENTIVIPLKNVFVVDGDTVHGVSNSGETIKVRMTGIDAPENSQAMGDVSALSLRECVKGSGDIKLIADPNNLNDKYGRHLGKLVAGNKDCNLNQIQNGAAWFYEDFSDSLPSGDAVKFKNAQEQAKSNSIGIWMGSPTPPWEYRKANK